VTTIRIKVRRKGGPGSGHWGHSGIPGHHGGSAPSKGKAGKVSSDYTISRTARGDIASTIGTWYDNPNSDGATIARAAAAEAKDGTSSLQLYQGGSISAIATLLPNKMYDGYTEIQYVATKPGKGHGRKIVLEIVKDAVAKGNGLNWNALPDSIGFYNHIGFQSFKNPYTREYKVPVEDLRNWLAVHESDLG